MTGLSKQQKYVLVHIYKLWIQMMPHHWGVRWATSSSRSGAASMSRTLHRLEERGLILRQNDVSGNNAVKHPTPDGTMSNGKVRQPGDGRQKGSRTLSVTMLPAGIELAERLTSQASGDVNRLGRNGNQDRRAT